MKQESKGSVHVLAHSCSLNALILLVRTRFAIFTKESSTGWNRVEGILDDGIDDTFVSSAQQTIFLAVIAC